MSSKVFDNSIASGSPKDFNLQSDIRSIKAQKHQSFANIMENSEKNLRIPPQNPKRITTQSKFHLQE